MNKAKYWIWLSMALGAGARVDEILDAWPDPEKLYNESDKSRLISGVFTKARLERLKATDIKDAENAIEICSKNGWNYYTPDSPDYPDELRTLVDRPLVLFTDGDINLLKNKVAIGVVGTRNPTYDSVAIAKKLCGEMAQCGAVIVSGGALGIDAAAHEGALSAKGITACVLGCGLGTRYLMENDAMRREIAKTGVVISEYIPFTPASRTTFPIRNRIISGLSKGLLVVEAGEKSGSLITARFAAEQGKDVFAVPGSILVSSYSGVNRLIRDGARPVTCADDILSPYAAMYPDLLSPEKNSNELPKATKRKGDKKVNAKAVAPKGVSPDAANVYMIMGDDPVYSDEICEKGNLSAAVVMAALMELELSGAVIQGEGKMWNRI